jgi:hypothetical protein
MIRSLPEESQNVQKKKGILFRIYLDFFGGCGYLATSANFTGVCSTNLHVVADVATVGTTAITAISISAISALMVVV